MANLALAPSRSIRDDADLRAFWDCTREQLEQIDPAPELAPAPERSNLVEAITCPTLVNIGMRDETCPYRTIAPVFERIRTLRSLMVYPDLAHETCTDFNMHAIAWLQRYLAC